MSADKRRRDARKVALLRDTCDPATCKGLPPHGRIYLNVEGGHADSKELRELQAGGYLTKHRRQTGSVFGPHIRRSFYALTPLGWAAKKSGRLG